MVAYPNPNDAPLAHVPVAMRERRYHELHEQLSEQGIEMISGTDTAVIINLRHLTVKNGSVQRGQAALYSALELLRAVRVDCEPQDIGHILGNSFVSHAISRGLESKVPTLMQLLTYLTPDELIDNLEKATTFVFQDRHESDEVNERLKQGAAQDLVRHGLLDYRDQSYRNNLDRDHEAEQRAAVPELPEAFRAEVKPYRSPWDQDGEF